VYDEIYVLVDTFEMPATVGIAKPETITERVNALKNDIQMSI
jgi:isopropylmalate/homocitrate/citramalate synthase